MLIESIESYKSSKKYDSDSVIEILANIIECCGSDKVNKALRSIHESINGHHFNEYFADKVVNEFYYMDEAGMKVPAPFITKEKAKEYYSKYTRQLEDIEFYDFYVALNKVMSDHKKLLSKWFEEDQIIEKCIELTLSCMKDDDYPDRECKVWNQLKNYIK